MFKSPKNNALIDEIRDFTNLNELLKIHDRAWHDRPLLRETYYHFFSLIKDEIHKIQGGTILEVGSGISKIKDIIPQCVTSDYSKTVYADKIENVYGLSYSDGSLSTVIMVDVFHHLKYPYCALSEIYNKLLPSGKLIILEPAMSLLGKFIYGHFHHEPLGLNLTIDRNAVIGKTSQLEYYAAQGNAWRIFQKNEYHDTFEEWSRINVKLLVAADYMVSGGFTGRKLFPWKSAAFLRAIEKIPLFFKKLIATRMLIVMTK